MGDIASLVIFPYTKKESVLRAGIKTMSNEYPTSVDYAAFKDDVEYYGGIDDAIATWSELSPSSSSTPAQSLKPNTTPYEFLSGLYWYYERGGFWNVAAQAIGVLLCTWFTVAFVWALTTCVSWSNIASSLSSSPLPSPAKQIPLLLNLLTVPTPGARVALTIISVLTIIVVLAIHLVPQTKRAWMYRRYCHNQLDLTSDAALQYTPWNDFIQLVAHKDVRMLGYNGTRWQHLIQIITRKQNYLIALYNQRLINVSVPLFPRYKCVTTVFAWCFNLATRNVFTHTGEVSPDVLLGNEVRVISSLRRDFVRVGVLAAICAPLMLVAMLTYGAVAFLEQVRNGVGIVLTPTWSTRSEWQMRCYNEVDLVFQRRLRAAHKHAVRYANQFPGTLVPILVKICAYLLSLLLTPLLIISLVVTDASALYIIANSAWPRTLLWTLTVVAAALAVVRRLSPAADWVHKPHHHMNKLSEHVKLPDLPPTRAPYTGELQQHNWVSEAHTNYAHQRFRSHFTPRYIWFLNELLAIVTVPFILMYSMHDEVQGMVMFLRKHTVELAPGLGTHFNCDHGGDDDNHTVKQDNIVAATIEKVVETPEPLGLLVMPNVETGDNQSDTVPLVAPTQLTTPPKMKNASSATLEVSDAPLFVSSNMNNHSQYGHWPNTQTTQSQGRDANFVNKIVESRLRFSDTYAPSHTPSHTPNHTPNAQ